MTALTGWYPPEIKPVRVGFYETRGAQITTTAYWSGLLWILEEGGYIFKRQDRCWRGLANDPEAK